MVFEIVTATKEDEQLIDEVGAFRLEVWREETEVNEAMFAEGKWLEPLDYSGKHWIGLDTTGIVGAARLTIHEQVDDNPDGYLWKKAGLTVPTPVAHLCKLVVHRRVRNQGLASCLNKLRIEAAQLMGAKSIIVTASEKNARLLERLGFVDTGIRETFPNRPNFEFRGMQLIF